MHAKVLLGLNNEDSLKASSSGYRATHPARRICQETGCWCWAETPKKEDDFEIWVSDWSKLNFVSNSLPFFLLQGSKPHR